jgi:hypothetical protein
MTRVGITFHFEDGANSWTKFLYGNGLVEWKLDSFFEELHKQTFKTIHEVLDYCSRVGYAEPQGRCNPEVLDEFIVVIGTPNGVWLGGSDDDPRPK